MNPLSKNSSLEESINKMKSILKDLGSQITFSTQKHPLKNCYSVNLYNNNAKEYIFSNGKGSVEKASIASALGEYIERLQTNNFFTEFFLLNRQYYPDEKLFSLNEDFLEDKLKKIYDPNGELCGEDLVDYNSKYLDKIVTLPFENKSCNTTTYFPINILNNLYVSNGLATGNTPKEAQVQAISEIFERYVKIEVIKNGYSLPKFPKSVLQQYPKLENDILQLESSGYKVSVLDASLGGIFPVTAIALINPFNGTVFISFGSHPILEVSLERTMTELMQGRDLSDMDNFEQPTFDMQTVQQSSNLESHFIDSNGKISFRFLNKNCSFSYHQWQYNKKSTQDEYDFLSKIITNLNKDIYLREYNYLGFYSCQIVIPTLSEIYPIDDLIYNNINQGKFLRNMVLHFNEYEPEDILEQLEQLDDSVSIEKYIGVIFQNNFKVAEFKVQLYILLGDFDNVLIYLESSSHPLAFILEQLCRIYIEQLEWEEYEDGLYAVFGKEKVDNAVAIFNSEVDFIDVSFHTHYKNILKLYDQLDAKKRKMKLFNQ